LKAKGALPLKLSAFYLLRMLSC